MSETPPLVGHSMSPPTADQRQFLLIQWIEERPAHDGLTATEIADVSGLYDHVGHYRASRCFDDCKALAAPSVNRLCREGRPARWFANEEASADGR